MAAASSACLRFFRQRQRPRRGLDRIGELSRFRVGRRQRIPRGRVLAPDRSIACTASAVASAPLRTEASGEVAITHAICRSAAAVPRPQPPLGQRLRHSFPARRARPPGCRALLRSSDRGPAACRHSRTAPSASPPRSSNSPSPVIARRVARIESNRPRDLRPRFVQFAHAQQRRAQFPCAAADPASRSTARRKFSTASASRPRSSSIRPSSSKAAALPLSATAARSLSSAAACKCAPASSRRPSRSRSEPRFPCACASSGSSSSTCFQRAAACARSPLLLPVHGAVDTFVIVHHRPADLAQPIRRDIHKFRQVHRAIGRGGVVDQNRRAVVAVARRCA